MFAEALRTGLMDDPRRFVVRICTAISSLPIPDDEMRRAIQEFAYEDCARAVPRYFNSSTFRRAGHLWLLEAPDEVTGYLRELLEMQIDA